MALTVAGRTQLATLGLSNFVSVVQDIEDLDTFYFLQRGATDKIYKFTWPATIVEIADLGTTYQIYSTGRACLAQNFVYGLGVTDPTWHMGIGFTRGETFGVGPTVSVNLSTGAVTAYDPGGPGGAGYSNGDCFSWNDGSGTYFFQLYSFSGSNSMGMVWKEYGTNTGGTTTVNTGGLLNRFIFFTDDRTVVLRASSNWKKCTFTGHVLTLTQTLASDYLIYSNALYDSVTYLIDYGPRKAAYWGNWRYFFGIANRVSGGGLVAVFARKNIVTGQTSLVEVPGFISSGSAGLEDALDIGEIGTTVRLYWALKSNSAVAPYLYAAPVWTIDGNNNLLIDNESTNIKAVYTAPADGYIYVWHHSGDYGYCITKVADSELVSTTATASISAPGLLTLWKDKRVFFAGVTDYEKYLWWSAPYELQALDPGWDGYNTTVFDAEDITALIVLEDSVYCGSKKGWVRLRGKSPDHWVLDTGLATVGPLNNKAVSVTPFGAIYPRSDGLYIFNGYTSRLFFEQGKELMSNVNWDAVSKMFSLWDGRYYRLFYPSGSATSNDRELIVDLIGGLANARGTEGDRAAAAGFADIATNTIYLADEDGNIYTEGGGTATRSFEITSKEYPAQGLIQAGQYSKLHYDIDCAGAVVTITPIYDGVAQSGITIPANSSRTRSHILLPKGNAFRMGIKISASTNAAVKIYEPWVLE